MLVLSLSTTLISCGRSDRLLRDAAIQQAIVEAEATLPQPELPDYCKQPVPHAAVTIGEGLEGLLKREQAQLDKANGVIVDCSKFNRGR